MEMALQLLHRCRQFRTWRHRHHLLLPCLHQHQAGHLRLLLQCLLIMVRHRLLQCLLVVVRLHPHQCHHEAPLLRPLSWESVAIQQLPHKAAWLLRLASVAYWLISVAEPV